MHFQYFLYVDCLLHFCVLSGAQTDEYEGDQSDGNTRNGGPSHVPNVGKEIGSSHGRCKIRRVGKGGKLVAEIGAGDHGSGCHGLGNTHSLPNTDQGDAHRRCR